MSEIKIPATIEEARSSLNGLDKLLTAKEWERAAIVYAFTASGTPGPKGDRPDVGTISYREFSRFGITGLTHVDTVREYHRAWESAMQDGAPDVKPGDTITMPNLPWPPGGVSRRGAHATTDEIEAGVAKAIKEQPEKIVAQLIEENREVLVDTIAELPALGDEVTEATAAVRAKRAPVLPPRPMKNTDRVLITVINALNEFWDREVQAGPNRVTFQQVVETVIQNPQSPTLRSHSVPTAHLGNELLDVLAKHIAKSEDIHDGKTLTTAGVALVGEKQ